MSAAQEHRITPVMPLFTSNGEMKRAVHRSRQDKHQQNIGGCDQGGLEKRLG